MYDSIETIRKIFLGVFAALAVAFVFIIFVMKVEETKEKPPGTVVLKGTYARVYRDGRLKWEAWTDGIRIDKSGKHHEIKAVKRGVFYREEEPPLFFTAKRAVYNSETETLNLDGGVEMKSENGDYFRTGVFEWNGNQKRLVIPTPVEFSLDGNIYYGDDMEAWGEDFDGYIIRGNATALIPDLKKTGSARPKEDAAQPEEEKEEEPLADEEYTKDLKLTAKMIEYDRQRRLMKCYSTEHRNAIYMPGSEGDAAKEEFVTLEGAHFKATSFEVYIDEEREYARAAGRVKAVRKAEQIKESDTKARRALLKRETVYETEEAFYFWKKGVVDAPGPARATRPGVRVDAGRFYADARLETAALGGGVTIWQEKGDWLIEDGLIEDTGNQDRIEAARQATVVTSVGLDLDFNTENILAYGGVTLTQQKRRVSCSAARFDGSDRIWTLFGNPRIEEDDYNLSATGITYRESDGVMEALGEASSRKRIDDDRAADIADYLDERDGSKRDVKTISRENIVVTAAKLKYDESADMLTAEGAAAMKFLDITVLADRIRVDYSKDIAEGEGAARFDDPRNQAEAEKFMLDWKKKRMELSGKAKLKDRGRLAVPGEDGDYEPFDLEADRVAYNWGTKTGEAEGTVKMSAAGRRASAKKLSFDRDKKRYVFDGSVSIRQDDGAWLDRQRIFKEESDGKTAKVAKKTTDIICDKATFDDAAGRADLAGKPVLIKQEGRELRALKASADDSRKEFRAEGDVYMSQERGDWLFDDGIIERELEKEAETRLRRPMKATAALLISEYSEEKLYLEGGVNVVEGASSARADKLWHYGKSERTILEGDVSVKDEKKRTFSAKKIVYDSKGRVIEAYTAIKGEAFKKDLQEAERHD
ncbi:MAG TPA: LPS export ABC transporter periplasmic protein LptC [bacterium]|nr:LPS export ABC transporter periplasmic protein LptC [bacterium]